MKKTIRVLSVIMCLAVFATVCGCKKETPPHQHSYNEVEAIPKTCLSKGSIFHYECDCGKFFIKNGANYMEVDEEVIAIPSSHNFTSRTKAIAATCTAEGMKAHYYCSDCKKTYIKSDSEYVEATDADLVVQKKAHTYNKKVEADQYRLSEATEDRAQEYAMSCVCGKADETHTHTFTSGKTLAEYRTEDKNLYTPNALTLTLYDIKEGVYGFAWNTDGQPARPVVEIKEVGVEVDYRIVGGYFERLKSYNDDVQKDYYYIKAEIKLEPSKEYQYRVGDLYVNAYTEYVTFTAADTDESGVWSFAHVSDSQTDDNGISSADYYKKTLSGIASNKANRFIVHTGDVVEYSKYESYWRNMINGNFSYFATIPTMAVSGNHDTTYKSGDRSQETAKHFNYKKPAQSVDLGFYYSYSYGDVKFIMLNTNNNGGAGLETAQLNWLKEELKGKTEKWTIVALHNPLYSPGKWGSGSNSSAAKNLIGQLSDLFVDYKVDLVLQGHDHVVSKTNPIGKGGTVQEATTERIGGISYTVNPEGVVYVMNGPAGNQSRIIDNSFDESLYEYAEGSNACSWAEFEVNGEMITVRQKNFSGGKTVTNKTWGIKKTAVG